MNNVILPFMPIDHKMVLEKRKSQERLNADTIRHLWVFGNTDTDCRKNNYLDLKKKNHQEFNLGGLNLDLKVLYP